MKKFIRSSNDLLLSILMGAVAAFLLTNQKIIIGVENRDFETAIKAIYDIFVVAQI